MHLNRIALVGSPCLSHRDSDDKDEADYQIIIDMA